MIREITSASNPLVKHLRSLASSKKYRMDNGTFIAEGWRSIETLLLHGTSCYSIESLVASSLWKNDPRLPGAIESVVVPDFVFEKISDVQSAQGILAVVRHHPVPFAARSDAGRYLLVDGLADPGNLGTLIRSTVGSGFDGVLLHGDCVEPFNPKVVRATMGTFACCDLWNVGRAELDRLVGAGYEICTTTGYDGEDLYRASFQKKCVLAVGSEARGVSEDIARLSTRKITIPLAVQCESLNAAVAGSICMFQIARGHREDAT